MKPALTRRKTARFLTRGTAATRASSNTRLNVSLRCATLLSAVGACWAGPAAAAAGFANETTPGSGTLGIWWPSLHAWFGGWF